VTKLFHHRRRPYLQPTVPSFEYPRGDLAPQVHFVGPLLPPVPAGLALPEWWEEMLADPRPVALVTQGTVATDPDDLLLPSLDALITNGGYGGLHFALSHGVPLVVAGASEEKPELVARVNWSRVGVGMRTQRPGRLRLREAVQRVLAEPEHAARAAAVQAEMGRYGGPERAVDLLEQLAATGAPVLAGAARVATHA
jgi:UDP:flavonoid glycosyltransferase YjiC (YdhE family)